jgi:hypothetical protein
MPDALHDRQCRIRVDGSYSRAGRSRHRLERALLVAQRQGTWRVNRHQSARNDLILLVPQ